MSSANPITVNPFHKGAMSHLSNALLSSYESGWNGIHLAHYHQLSGEIPEHYISQHIISISAKNPEVLEVISDGKSWITSSQVKDNLIIEMIIREARLQDANAIAQVHVDAWKTTYSGILPTAYIERRTYAKRCKSWNKMLEASMAKITNHAIYVAEFEGEIIGFVDGGTQRSANPLYQGEIYALYILEAYQRKGLGSSLTRTIARRLSQLGLDSILVWVLADNCACKFYQSLGGQEVEQKLVYFDGSKFQEIAYGWQNTHNLIAS